MSLAASGTRRAARAGSHQQGYREGGVDRERQFGLDVLGDALGAQTQRPGAVDDGASVLNDRRPGLVSVGVFVDRSNSATPERRLHGADGLADRRLDPAELREAAEKLPVSATATRTRIWSRVSESIIHHLRDGS